MLAIMRALYEWQHYLQGSQLKFEILDGPQESGVLHHHEETQ
jgi:hypothetical protein